MTAGPTDVRLLPFGSLGTADAGGDFFAASDRGGDLELDIDLDLDRVADAEFGADADLGHDIDDESGRELRGLAAVDLTGGEDDEEWLADEDVLTAFAEDPEDPDLSGEFDVVHDTDASDAFPAARGGSGYSEPCEEFDGHAYAAEAGPVRRQRADQSDRRYGDRVEGWIRPQYGQESEPVLGEYWTPVPEGSYASGYGWPVPVERLPEVPPYPPASGSDVAAETESEPTAVVLQWPPARPNARIELPRSWSYRDEAADREDVTHRDDVPHRNELPYRDDVPCRDWVTPRDDLAYRDESNPRDDVPYRDGVTQRDDLAYRDGMTHHDGVTHHGGIAQLDGMCPGEETAEKGIFADERGRGHGEADPRTSGTRGATSALRDPDERRLAAAFDEDERRGVAKPATGTVRGHETGPPDGAGPREGTAARDAGRFRAGAGRPDEVATPDKWRTDVTPVPAERAPATPRYAAREESLDGPIWTAPELPEAVMPDLSWAPGEARAGDAPRRPPMMIRRQRDNTTGEDTTQALPSLDSADQPRARPRPRPRPRPGTGQPDPRSTVYVSRHAAEPS